RERPLPVEYLRARAIEPHRVVPAGHGRQAVGDLPVAAAELDADGAVVALLRGDVVQRIGVPRVRLEVAFGVVEADGTERVARNVPDGESIHRLPVVLLGSH